MKQASILHRAKAQWPGAVHTALRSLLPVALFVLAPALRSAEITVSIHGVDADLAAQAQTASGIADLDCQAAAWALGFRLGRLESTLRDGLRARGHHGPGRGS